MKQKKPTLKSSSRGAERIAALRKGLNQFKITRWPGGDFDVKLVPLSDDAIQICQAAAMQRFQDIGIPVNLYTTDELNREIHIQALAVAMYDTEDGALLFTDADEFRELVEPQEREQLTSEYIDIQKRANPSSIDREQIVQIDKLVKKNDVENLSSLGGSMLAAFLTCGDVQLSISLIGNSENPSTGLTPGSPEKSDAADAQDSEPTARDNQSSDTGV